MPPINKKKQEQLTEDLKEIRKSTKENLVCADCPNRAPSYVCLNFSTFVCTECSGVHRKFGHRVKSIAVATFTEEEVEKMRQGGNEAANSHYLARYKKGQDTFVLPREGERDRIEQYLTFKYVDKKWYKETLKPKEKKSKKTENKTDGDDTGDVEEEQVTTSKPKRASVTTGVSSSKQPVQQTGPDLLSFDEVPSSKEDNTKKNTAQDQDALFDNSSWDDGHAQKPDDWGGDDLWGDDSSKTSSNTTTSKGQGVNLSSLYQTTNQQNYQTTNQNNVGVFGYPNQNYNGQMNMQMNMWGQQGNMNPMPMNNQPIPQTTQGSSFLDALTTVNQQQQQKQLEEEKKKKEEVVKQTSKPLTVQPKEEPKEDDPFASLMDSSGLSSKSDTTTTTTNSSRRTSGTYSLNSGTNIGIPSVYGGPSQPIPSPNLYYGGPNTSMTNQMMPNQMMPNMMPTNMMPQNMYVTGGYGMPMGPNMGGGMYVPNQQNTTQMQPQYQWGTNPSYGTSDTDNPFR